MIAPRAPTNSSRSSSSANSPSPTTRVRRRGQLPGPVRRTGRPALRPAPDGGFTLDVAWEEIKFSRQHAGDFRRIAVLTDDQWLTWSAWVSQLFVTAEVWVFDDEDEARAWLAAETTGAAGKPRSECFLCDADRCDRARAAPATPTGRVRLPADLVDPAFGQRAYDSRTCRGLFIDRETGLSGPKTGRNGRHPLPTPPASPPGSPPAGGTTARWSPATTPAGCSRACGGCCAGSATIASRCSTAACRLWMAAGLALDDEPPVPRPDRRWRCARTGWDTRYVLQHLGSPDMLLLVRAARTASRREQVLDPVGGHPRRSQPLLPRQPGRARLLQRASLREEFAALLGACRARSSASAVRESPPA